MPVFHFSNLYSFLYCLVNNYVVLPHMPIMYSVCDYFMCMILFTDHADSSSQRYDDVCDAFPGQGNSDDSYGRIYTTSRPIELKNALEELNQAQCDSVIEMGFGDCWSCRLLTPSRLGFWLVNNFDPRSRTLTPPRGDAICISAKDVALMMGFLMGWNWDQEKASEPMSTSMEYILFFMLLCCFALFFEH